MPQIFQVNELKVLQKRHTAFGFCQENFCLQLLLLLRPKLTQPGTCNEELINYSEHLLTGLF
jgi:hypothetical protein